MWHHEIMHDINLTFTFSKVISLLSVSFPASFWPHPVVLFLSFHHKLSITLPSFPPLISLLPFFYSYYSVVFHFSPLSHINRCRLHIFMETLSFLSLKHRSHIELTLLDHNKVFIEATVGVFLSLLLNSFTDGKWDLCFFCIFIIVLYK